MKYFDFTLPTPAENLACDEALLDLGEGGMQGEILRFWEPNGPFIVVGYANEVAREVNLPACKSQGIPVLRRCSGGGTVVQGAGCLNYSLILNIGGREGAGGQDQGTDKTAPSTASIASTNSYVMQRHRAAIEALVKKPVRVAGHTDLTIGNLKFSGNAQRRLRHALIFHGTFLLQFDLTAIEQLLPLPSKQPDYRQNRGHADFLTNLNLDSAAVKSALRKIWGAEAALENVPADAIRELAANKYSTDDWNFKF